MPLFEYRCLACGQFSEVLMIHGDDQPRCTACGSPKMEKLISAHASASGVASNRMPGPGDTACCGNHPGEANCTGPGSCCGRQF
jgi:putative FmdB family regulatory protein